MISCENGVSNFYLPTVWKENGLVAFGDKAFVFSQKIVEIGVRCGHRNGNLILIRELALILNPVKNILHPENAGKCYLNLVFQPGI